MSPRLEWKHSPEGEAGEPACWYVEGFPVDVSVMEDAAGYDWFVSFTRGTEPTVDAAKEAAETAALKLLCEAVAAFGVEHDDVITNTLEPGIVRAHGYRHFNHGAVKLACALISAATKAGGEVDRG